MFNIDTKTLPLTLAINQLKTELKVAEELEADDEYILGLHQKFLEKVETINKSNTSAQ